MSPSPSKIWDPASGDAFEVVGSPDVTTETHQVFLEPKLLDQIFSHLPYKSLFAVRSVCRLWRLQGQEAFFSQDFHSTLPLHKLADGSWERRYGSRGGPFALANLSGWGLPIQIYPSSFSFNNADLLKLRPQVNFITDVSFGFEDTQTSVDPQPLLQLLVEAKNIKRLSVGILQPWWTTPEDPAKLLFDSVTCAVQCISIYDSTCDGSFATQLLSHFRMTLKDVTLYRGENATRPLTVTLPVMPKLKGIYCDHINVDSEHEAHVICGNLQTIHVVMSSNWTPLGFLGSGRWKRLRNVHLNFKGTFCNDISPLLDQFFAACSSATYLSLDFDVPTAALVVFPHVCTHMTRLSEICLFLNDVEMDSEETLTDEETLQLLTGLKEDEIPENEADWTTVLNGKKRSMVNLKLLQEFSIIGEGRGKNLKIAQFLFRAVFLEMPCLKYFDTYDSFMEYAYQQLDEETRRQLEAKFGPTYTHTDFFQSSRLILARVGGFIYHVWSSLMALVGRRGLPQN